MDFFRIAEKRGTDKETKEEYVTVFPDFVVTRATDLMVRGKSFYAVWDDAAGMWSTNEYDVQRLVDHEMGAYAGDLERQGLRTRVRWMRDFSSKSWMDYRSYIGHVSDNLVQLDERLTFSGEAVSRDDYVSKRLPYAMDMSGHCPSYDQLMSELYDPEERQKLEWAIGSVFAGASRHIQKFVVLYGSAGSGKSTVLNIIQSLFEGYYAVFDSKALVGNNNAFALEPFKTNPLVAIQHDGDLSKVEDNTKLNSIVSHEEMTVNEKNKPLYTTRFNAFLFVGTNQPVKITDAKSGIIRRLIDVAPSGRKVDYNTYMRLMAGVQKELGGIAKHCLDVFNALGVGAYDGYIPLAMMAKTDVFYNFVEENRFQFARDDGVQLQRAYDMYKEYCEDALISRPMPKYRFRDELGNYFKEFHERARVDGERVRQWYAGFRKDRFEPEPLNISSQEAHMTLDSEVSLIDALYADCPAQYASESGTPVQKWDDVTTTLKDLDTRKEHYVRIPDNHIVIDIDLRDESGEKSAARCLEEAARWPATYAEFSKGGSGVHLHYEYAGDPSSLASHYSDGVEIKCFTGLSSLRRRLSTCNEAQVSRISSGLPRRRARVINESTVKTEQGLRRLIERNMRKEFHPGTKPSIDFIHKILEDAYASGMAYDVRDMRNAVLGFAMCSTNQSAYCVKLVSKMKWQSEAESEPGESKPADDRVVYFDCEVFPNLFLCNWKFKGDPTVKRMINPSADEIARLMEFKLVGFNNRKYDNHIIYGAYLGYDNERLCKLSQRIVSNDREAFFAEAYNLSYADVYDYSSKKQSLKKWEIELGIKHKELGLPWDEPVPEEKWTEVAEYCDNDVIALEAVADACHEDWVARQVLADLSGLSVNHSTNSHSAKIIFGGDREAKKQFVYTDLSEMFPGYVYDYGKSTYKGYETGEGGFVYAEVGMWENVALLDVASMHPTSIEQLNLFGDKYTKRFSELKQARLHIKHGDFEAAGSVLDGALKPYLKDESQSKDLAAALKIVINSVYGLTAAHFDNPFNDPRNKDNIVAKRGALFMIDLKEFIESEGFIVAHIKTDSVKIPNATPEIIKKVIEFGKRYGYDFEHEDTYEKMCLVNQAVYIAKSKSHGWTATGAQFQHPVVFKTLFTDELPTVEDMSETKSVKTSLWLDYNEDLPEGEHNRVFVGRVGRFTPVEPGCGGGVLERASGDDTYSAVTGTKGYRWVESEGVDIGIDDSSGHKYRVDESYYRALVQDALDAISEHCDAEAFRS